MNQRVKSAAAVVSSTRKYADRDLSLLLDPFEQLLQLARLVHLAHDVRAADELAV